MTKNITIHDTNKPLVVVKPVTTYHDGYQNVTFKCDDENATIYYTRDGSDQLNSTNIRQADNSTILTLSNLTQLKYYAINQYNITSPVYLYRTPRNEVSPVNISVRKESDNYNTHKIVLQTNNNHTTHYTIDRTIPTTDSINTRTTKSYYITTQYSTYY